MSYASTRDAPTFRPDDKEKEGSRKTPVMNTAFIKGQYMSVQPGVMTIMKRQVFWIGSFEERPKSLSEMFECFLTRLQQRLKQLDWFRIQCILF